MEKLVSIDLKANMGMLKKPDINESIYLTFNMLHKPALLGILGAICGMQGYQKRGEFPEYYKLFKTLMVGIQPLAQNNPDFNGNISKTVIQYNNSVGYASQEAGGNLVVHEQILLNPAFRCYLLLDFSYPHFSILGESLSKNEAEYLPYFGKNEHSLWWENYRECNHKDFDFSRDFRVDTVFMKKDQLIRPQLKGDEAQLMGTESTYRLPFINFERLPVGFDEKLVQYQYEEFVYTNSYLKKDTRLENLFELEGQSGLIQLF